MTVTQPDPTTRWGVFFREKGSGRAKRLTPKGTLTTLAIHAARFENESRAEEVAASIRTSHPDAEVTVRSVT